MSTIPWNTTRRNSLNRMLEAERNAKVFTTSHSTNFWSLTVDQLGRIKPLSSHPTDSHTAFPCHPTSRDILEESRSRSSSKSRPSESKELSIAELPTSLPIRSEIHQMFDQDETSQPPSLASRGSEDLPDLEHDNGGVSDASSICHSPSWSDYGSKKKKQKKKEKERKASVEQKAIKDQKPKPRRLTKVPPRTHKFSTSKSASDIQTVPQLPDEIPTISSDNVGTNNFQHRKSASNGGNVISGLKLNVANEEIALQKSISRSDSKQDKPRDTLQSVSLGEDHPAPQEHLKPNQTGSRTFAIHGPPTRPIYELSDSSASRRTKSFSHVLTSRDEDSFDNHIAKGAEPMDRIPPLIRTTGLAIENRRSVSLQYTMAWPYDSANPNSLTEPSNYDNIRAAVETDLASIRSARTGTSRRQRSSAMSPYGAPTISDDSIENPLSRVLRSKSSKIHARNSVSSNNHLTKESIPRPAAELLTPPYDDEIVGATEKLIPVANSHAEEDPEAEDGDMDQYHAFLVGSLDTKSYDSQRPKTSNGLTTRNHKKSNTSLSQPKGGFRISARAGFLRKSLQITPASSTEELRMMTTSSREQDPQKLSLTKETSATTRPGFIRMHGSKNKAEEILGAPVSAIKRNITFQLPAIKTIAESTMSLSSAMDRSDDPDGLQKVDNSDSTTPTGSRPHSSKAIIPGENKASSATEAVQVVVLDSLDMPANLIRADAPSARSSVLANKVFSESYHQGPVINLKSTSAEPEWNEEDDCLPELNRQALKKRPAKRAATMDPPIPAPVSNTITTSASYKNRYSTSKVPTVPGTERPTIRPMSPTARSGEHSPKPHFLTPRLPDSQLATRPTAPVVSRSSEYLQSARLSAPRRPPVALHSRSAPNTRNAIPSAQLESTGPQANPISQITQNPSTSRPSSILNDHSEPLAKMFVICCQCKFFHDLPSKIYEAMAKPESIVEDRNIGIAGAVTMMVGCPWCRHGMSTQCCAGYAAVVQLKERFH
jgi:hypothetical protein